MKQKLFALMSVAAVLASCSNDDFLTQAPSNEAPKSAGIVFNLVDGTATRGEFTTDEAGKFATSWNAETDRIGIIYSGAVKGLGTAVAGANATLWNGIAGTTRGNTTVSAKEIAFTTASSVNTPALAIYKTTRSGASGWVTAVDDDNILKFAAEEEDPDDQVLASFRAVRPVKVNMNNSVSPSVKYSNTAGVETMLAAVPAFNAQTQTSLEAEFDNFFMVAAPINNIYSASNAVGEELALAFERPFAALAVRTKGYDEDVYGVLKSVTVTMPTSDIACSDESTVDIAKKDENGNWVVAPGTKTKSVKLTVGTGSGLEWSDDAYAFIQILPIVRTNLDAAERYTVALEFANGTITINKSTSNNWTANSFVKVTCDLDNENYIYLTNGGANKLIVNTAMPELTGTKGSKVFGGSNAASAVKELVAKVALTADELKAIKDEFTGVTKMTLANQSADLGSNLANVTGTPASVTDLTLTNATSAPVLTGTNTGVTTLSCPVATSIPANAFNGNIKLTKAYFPVVATIGDNAFTGATYITTVGCANSDALQIGTTDIYGVKSSALTSIGTFSFSSISDITKVDAPELTTMGARAFGNTPLNSVTHVLLPKYDFDNTYNAIALLSGTSLKEADLSAVPELGATTIAFTGNTNLTDVILKDGVNVGMSAFAGCSTLANVKNLDKAAAIGENAFQGTKLAKALVNVATIGKNAFKGCTSLGTLTLGANVTAISESAFEGCTSLGTINNLANVTSIGKNAFKGAAITTFDFLNASMAEGAFRGCTSLVGQVRSNATTLEKNVFQGDNKVSNFVFANVTTIKEGALTGLLSTAPFATITFGSALTSIHQKAFCTPATATTEMDGSTAEKAITGTANYNLILTDKTGLSIKGAKVTFVAADGKYYKITFQSVQ